MVECCRLQYSRPTTDDMNRHREISLARTVDTVIIWRRSGLQSVYWSVGWSVILWLTSVDDPLWYTALLYALILHTDNTSADLFMHCNYMTYDIVLH